MTTLKLAAAAVLGAVALGGVAVAAETGGGAGSSAGSPGAKVRDASSCTVKPGLRRLKVESGRVPVVLYIPGDAQPGGRLVLGLPGAGQTASAFARYTGYSRLADQKGFSVAYPTASGTRPFWNISDADGQPDDVAYLRKVIDAAVRASCADADRVTATGVSNGGGMSARLACDASGKVAAVAPVAGGYGSLPECRPPRPVPVLEIHGYRDEVVPYRGKGATQFGSVLRFLAQWRSLDGCSVKAGRSRPQDDVEELRWSGCKNGTVVVHDRIFDAEHGWPGENALTTRNGFSSTLRTWRFLSAFRR